VAIARSRIGGSTVFSAANIQRDRPRACIGIVWQQAGMALGDMEHDGPGFGQGEIAFLIDGDLPGAD
jgi:hypothetical protein